MRAEESVGGYTRAAVTGAALRLDLNEAPREAGAAFRALVLELLAGSAWNLYPDMDAQSARQAAAELYGWRAEGTLVGNGSNELLAATIRALVPAGGTLVAPSPSFSMYPVLATRQSARLLELTLRPPRFAVARGELLALAREADLIVVCSPNSPDGGEVEDEVWPELLALGKPVLWDAAYADFSARARPVELLERHANLVVLRTLSKAWGLAGLRAGALLADPALAARVGEQLLPFGTGWLVAAAFRAAVRLRGEGEDLVREIVAERERELAAISSLGGLEALPSAANFFLLRRFGWRGQDLAATLLARGIAVREVPELDDAGFVRVTVGSRTSGEVLLAALVEASRG